MGMQHAIIDASAPARHLITVEEFLILDRAGAFENVGRAQLIDGEIYIVNAIHRAHARTQLLMGVAFHQAIGAVASPLQAYCPVSANLDDHSLPEPDVVVATVAEDNFVSPDSIRIAIEISDSSLSFDLGKKAALYARTGVPEYWVVDLNGRAIIRMADPADGVYRARDTFGFGEMIPCVTLPEIIVDTASLA